MKNLPGKLGRGSAKQTLRVLALQLAQGGLFVKTINKKSSGLQTCLFAPPSHVFFFLNPLPRSSLGALLNTRAAPARDRNHRGARAKSTEQGIIEERSRCCFHGEPRPELPWQESFRAGFYL